uniref:Glycosyltransferase family 92 protein n=1 Tax=Amphora coffeiformis TaxID=265554 RepID=A0A7S3KZY0_9STRA
MKDSEHIHFKNGDYLCDGNSPARVLRHGQKFLNQLKLYCPRNATQLVFDTKDAAVRQKLTFDLKPYLACDRLQQALMPFNSKQAKIAACTQVKYPSSYDLVPQWIEYHRMIGIDTFWIYINDDMKTYEAEAPDVMDYFQRRDVQQYASALPYGWPGENVEPFFFQRVLLNECIENGLRNNVTWVLLSDVDEFVNIVDHNKSLKDVVKVYEPDDNVAGVSLSNTLYGFKDTHPAFDRSKPPVLVRDFVYRDEPNAPQHRSKVLVKPDHVQYMVAHKISIATHGHEAYLDPFREARQNHYQRACVRSTLDSELANSITDRLEERLNQVYHPRDPARFYPTEINDHCK